MLFLSQDSNDILLNKKLKIVSKKNQQKTNNSLKICI